MAADGERRFLDLAFDLAEAGWGAVHPNPLVGAVVVRDGAVVGRGAHRRFGGDHAEIEALRDAGDAARGADLYVTLEPCAHHGKTPPCCDAIAAAGIRRVVFAAADPTALAGGGAGRLAAAGIDVVGPLAPERARAQNAIFFHAAAARGPFLALKYALSLDARLSRTADAPTDITGDLARRDAHRLRAGYDALLVGRGTALADDPRLTVRGDVRPRRPPLRVVLDAGARLAPDSRLASTARDAPLRVYVGSDAPAERRSALERRGATVRQVGRGEDGLDVAAVLADLAGDGVASILCEGGGRLGASLLRRDVVERLHLYAAPLLLGESAVAAFPGGFPAMEGAAAPCWRRTAVRELGTDLRVDYDRLRER